MCSECKYTFEQFFKIAESNTPLTQSCPECGQYDCIQKKIGPTPTVSGVNLQSKIPNEFRDRLREISKLNPRNTIEI